MPTVVTMTNGDIITLGFSTSEEELVNEAFGTIEKYCGSDFLRYYKGIAAEAAEKLEAENYDAEAAADEYRDALNEIASALDEYKKKVFDKKSKLYRKDIDSMMTAISGIIDEVI